MQNVNSRIEIEFRLVANQSIRLSQRNNCGGLTIDCRGDLGNFQVARSDRYGLDDCRSSLELPSGAYQIRIVASGLGSSGMRGIFFPNEIGLDFAPIEPVTVPRDFATIQAALDAAAPNSLIMVSEGTYNEAIDFKGKSITVKAVGARANTIIDGTGKTTSVVRAVTGETSATVLQGFTIRNGTSGTLVNGHRVGGGMVVQNASPTIRDCAFVSNLADAGGGLAAINSHLVIDGCTFSTNTAGTGGGLWLDFGLPSVTNCVISDNTAAGHGGGLYATPLQGQLPNALLSGNTVCGNASGDAGRTNVWALVDDSGNTICDCFGDVDSNGVSDTADISLTLLFFGGETDPEFIQPDQDMNGTVDTGDVALLLLNFGPCG
jgi:predicted outer membrane repeat protein